MTEPFKLSVYWWTNEGTHPLSAKDSFQTMRDAVREACRQGLASGEQDFGVELGPAAYDEVCGWLAAQREEQHDVGNECLRVFGFVCRVFNFGRGEVGSIRLVHLKMAREAAHVGRFMHEAAVQGDGVRHRDVLWRGYRVDPIEAKEVFRRWDASPKDRGTSVKVLQEFRDADPDRLARVFRDTLEREVDQDGVKLMPYPRDSVPAKLGRAFVASRIADLADPQKVLVALPSANRKVAMARMTFLDSVGPDELGDRYERARKDLGVVARGWTRGEGSLADMVDTDLVKVSGRPHVLVLGRGEPFMFPLDYAEEDGPVVHLHACCILAERLLRACLPG